MSDKKTQTRARILGAATQALLERGAVEPSVGEVMGAAGLTVGGFYAHFQSKDALMLEAFEQLLGKRRELLGELDPGLSGKERRALAAAFYLSRKHRDAQVDAGCPLPATLAEVARLPEGFREVLSRHVEIMVASLAESPEETDVALADLVLMIGGLALARALGPGEAVRPGSACRQAGGELRRYEMSSLTWIRGFNGTIGRIAPRWTAERMRRAFMMPGEWPPKDWELPLLASSERVTLRFGLSVLRWGEGPAVLLLHGWAGRPTQFAHLIEQLVGAGYSVYALDAPAHGRSPGREANVVLFAHALLEAAGELPPLRAVVGHSLGGAAALLAAQMGLRSEALVTVSAPSRILEQLRLFARFVGLPALARSHFIRLVERQAGISAACLDVARYRLEMPGLVVHADDDPRVAVENAERIHAAWPASRLLRLPGGGHHRLLGERRLSESLLALLEERPAMRACRRVEKTASAS